MLLPLQHRHIPKGSSHPGDQAGFTQPDTPSTSSLSTAAPQWGRAAPASARGSFPKGRGF